MCIRTEKKKNSFFFIYSFFSIKQEAVTKMQASNHTNCFCLNQLLKMSSDNGMRELVLNLEQEIDKAF